MDHLTALTVFRHVVDRGSFAGAGRYLSLSPAAISKNISELEAHLKVRLLNRTTRHLSLTEAGTHYYERIIHILDDLTDVETTLSSTQQTPSGLLRISAPMTLTLIGLSTAIPIFLSRYPALSIDLHLDDHRVDIVREGYDIVIRGSRNLEHSSLIARKLTTMPHVVCGSPEYFKHTGTPQRPEELEKHNCIQFSLSNHADLWEFTNTGTTVSVPINSRYKITSSLAVRDALRAGFGLSLIPRLYVEEDLEQGTLITVLDDWSSIETSVYAIYPSRRHLVSKVRCFIDFLIGYFDKRTNAPTQAEKNVS